MNSFCSVIGAFLVHSVVRFSFDVSGNAVEFGAQQCLFCYTLSRYSVNKVHAGILVRNDNARDQLRKQVGEIGVILSVITASH